MQTKGECLVGIGPDPSSHGLVDDIRGAAAALIDLIEEIPLGYDPAQSVTPRHFARAEAIGRIKSQAQVLAAAACRVAVAAADRGDA